MEKSHPPGYATSPQPPEDIQWFLLAIQLAHLEGYHGLPFHWLGFQQSNCLAHLLKLESHFEIDPPAPDTPFLISGAQWRTGRVIAKSGSSADLVLAEAGNFRDDGEIVNGILNMKPFEFFTNNHLRESTLALAWITGFHKYRLLDIATEPNMERLGVWYDAVQKAF